MSQGLDISREQWSGIKALYDAEIRFADEVAKQLLQEARTASNRKLIVVITGDHGDLFGESNILGHNLLLHDGLIRVPLIVIGINGMTDGKETVTQHIDVTRTLSAITDVTSDQFEGQDLRDTGRTFGISQRGIVHMDAYTKHNSEFDIELGSNPVTAVRTTDYKYIEGGSSQLLYDLPDEETNMSDIHPDVVEKLSDIITDRGIIWKSDSGQEQADFGQETQQRLQDLGYLTD
ncbi:sulfatase-like hydrolase/transferase [Haloarcula sp. S1CR25-12]|uniref:Sulfatase-like hydrolase/transferase n=1 Tax=Haloarcula saliterrae TaxID=2950534 RepID=A0ABU2FBX7_9EURY|nr:sulfatase-like hydrolase/transferase [Haloarcula sp. S1CR25-12]MDS0259772.1 sulfatase-like hydrolase/transferase [Haloarcula sp. S1CR25-12]